MKKKNNRQLVYLGTICKVEDKAGIFLSDVYVKKVGESYVNYFDASESFTTKFEKEGDIFITIMSSGKMSESEVFKHMLYNPQYCKDRVGRIKELFANEKFAITNDDFERCREVIQLDNMCYDRYDSCDSVTRYYIKQKTK